jgi:diguanylate cyclase (GGDEF)-like protein
VDKGDVTSKIQTGDLPRRRGTPACLVLIYGGELGRRYPLTEEAVTIGRANTNAVMLDTDTVSRHHARVFKQHGAWAVEDLGSTNGTFLGEVQTEGAQTLRNGDLLKMGVVVFKFIEGGNVEALYHEEIHRLAILDGLTQAYNKRYLLEFLEREVARAQRHDRPLSLVLLDVDHFKRLNDRYGHLAGDNMLRRLAHVIQGRIRRDEIFARYGGEEFAIVLPETGPGEAMPLCEQIREAVAESVVTHDDAEIRATISIGVAGLRPGFDVAAPGRAAHEQLYRAKAEGRNRVAAAPDELGSR